MQRISDDWWIGIDATYKTRVEDGSLVFWRPERTIWINLWHEEATVRRIWRMLDLAEYKRRQAPPGVKITRRAFGRDRRYPITNGFRS